MGLVNRIFATRKSEARAGHRGYHRRQCASDDTCGEANIRELLKDASDRDLGACELLVRQFSRAPDLSGGASPRLWRSENRFLNDAGSSVQLAPGCFARL